MPTRSDRPDIIRGALILLVVWGHLIESIGFQDRIYFAIYLFHIPAFAIISGMFSKAELGTKDALRLVQRLLVPLILFQVLYVLALTSFAPDRVVGPLVPVWTIWFLASLLIWKVVLPWVLLLPFPMLFSCVAALAAGYVNAIGLEFGLSRTFVFWPAFIFGHLYGARALELATRHRVVLGGMFAALFFGALVASDFVSIRWLWGARSYAEMDIEQPAALARGLVIFFGIIASIGFFAILPSRSRPLAWFGRNSMQIYLLHGFPVILFWSSGIQAGGQGAFLLITALLAVGIAVAIGWVSLIWRKGTSQLS